MSDEFDTKYHIEQLNKTDNEISKRLMKAESALRALFEAVSRMSEATNPAIQKKLNEAFEHLK
ncbi:MAG: hypothetical protein K2W95_24405 [Candidatus Obscuribacterales bacterium]|nr:hypothetical protein [Candidatus Obscuribacterales bacterium]